MNKKKILFVTESHKLASGFGTYAKELLARIHATGKYEIAQLASYARPDEFENNDWLVYGVAPMGNEGEYAKHHASFPPIQWGLNRFELACLDFKPDIVVAYRDPWMDAYIADSPFLPLFHWVWMPTIDSEPQKTEWLYMFNRCDGLLTYSEYGDRTLQKQTNGRLKSFASAPAGIDPNVFNIIPNKKEHKKAFGLDPDSIIFGTVMRNQKRKMFPELMKAFKQFIAQAPSNIADKSYLYLHTSHPEKHGWNITSLMHEFGLGSKLLVTYTCQTCKKYFVSNYMDAITICSHCGNHSATLPGVSQGIPHEELPNLYNLMDLYIQYAICEGLGMPQIEAAACGTPIASINYSAMEDVVKFTNGYPIEPILERELETNADRSKANPEALIKIFNAFTKQTDQQKKQQRLSVRKGCIKKYTWDKTSKIWENYFDQVQLTGLQGKWDSPPLMKPIPQQIPQGLNNNQFAEWVCNSLLQDPYHAFNYKMLKMVQSLNLGVLFEAGRMEKCDPQVIYEENRHVADRRYHYDAMRTGQISIPPQQFIMEAHRRMKK